MNTHGRFFAPRASFTSVARALLVFLLSFGSLYSSLASADIAVRGCDDLEPVSGRYIVRAGSAASVSEQSVSLVEQLALEAPERVIHRSTSLSALSSSQKPTEKSTLTLVTELSDDQLHEVANDSRTLSIEQDCIIHVADVATLVPNDPVPATNTYVRDQLRLTQAWAQRTDAQPILVSVSDTGLDLTHEDLSQNLWTNTAEVNGQAGVDDDGNGCIDDIHGCDFGDYDGDPSPFSGGDGVHGTHVAGIIGARGDNGLGSVGVAWRVQLLAAKGFDLAGNAYISDLLNTIYYSVNNGARVINCSWGADRTPTQAEKDAFQFAVDHGVLPVVAAGNSAIDAVNSSPAGIDSVLTVGSINSLDQVSAFSNFGTHVHVYAPGGDAGTRNEFIYSTLPGNKYGLLRGTSMATPFVSGIAALVFSVNPQLSAMDVKNILITSAREVSSILPKGATATIKIPDASAALILAATYVPTPFKSSASPSTPVAQKPAYSPSDAQFVSSSSSSCSLHRSQGPDWSLVVLIAPLMMALALRKKSA